MQPTKKTKQVLEELNVTIWALYAALRSKIRPLPAKDISGDWAWTEEDVERARVAMATDLRKSRSRGIAPVTATGS
jgi:hypothetical protein